MSKVEIDSPPHTAFSQALGKIRKAKKVPQIDLARRAGMSQSKLSKLEKGALDSPLFSDVWNLYSVLRDRGLLAAAVRDAVKMRKAGK